LLRPLSRRRMVAPVEQGGLSCERTLLTPALWRCDPEPLSVSQRLDLAVLWIDDDPSVVTYAFDVLTRAGCRVTQAPDGRAGLALVRQSRYDVMVLDHRMPGGLLGIDVLRIMRDEGIDIPVMVFTGYGSEALAFASGQLGATRYYAKPLHGAGLIAAIRETATAKSSHRSDAWGGLGSSPTTESVLAALEEFEGFAQRAHLAATGQEQIHVLRRDIARWLADPNLSLLQFFVGAAAFRPVLAGDLELPFSAQYVRAQLESAAGASVSDPRPNLVLATIEAAGSSALRVSLGAVARDVGLAPVELSRVIHDQLRFTFRQCRRRVVLRRGVMELSTSREPVAQIAYHLEYGHPSIFDRHFRWMFGLAPRDFRKLVARSRNTKEQSSI
jgi:DNA-binding response OmpR family regulator